jgi:hypothetical protein
MLSNANFTGQAFGLELTLSHLENNGKKLINIKYKALWRKLSYFLLLN